LVGCYASHGCCIRRTMASTTRAALHWSLSVQSPHLRVDCQTPLVRLTSSCWIFRLHSVTPYSRLLDASVEGGVEDTMHFCLVVCVLYLMSCCAYDVSSRCHFCSMQDQRLTSRSDAPVGSHNLPKVLRLGKTLVRPSQYASTSQCIDCPLLLLYFQFDSHNKLTPWPPLTATPVPSRTSQTPSYSR
jgi:hypothetical protein